MTSSNDRKHPSRPWWQILVVGSLLGIALGMALRTYGMLLLVHPVEVWVEGDSTDARILAATVNAAGVLEAAKMENRTEPGLVANFKTPRFPYKGIILIGSPAALERVTSVTVRMSQRNVVSDRSQFQNEWTLWQGELPADTPAGWEGRVFQRPLSADGSSVDLLHNAINYEGDAALVKYVLFNPLMVAYAIFFVMLLALRGFTIEAPAWVRFMIDDADTVAEQRGWPWLVAELGVLIAAGVMLEQQQPYYFSQDDNFAQFLPNILYGCETLSAGVFPNWNPHQYLGVPLAEIGTYALTYPGTYLSYGIAVHVLGDRNATIEVFCWMHLLLGYCATYWLGQRLDLAAPLASAFSLCQVLSGFALIGGRSWYYMTPICLWAPLLFVALLQVRACAPTLRWTIGTGIVIGLFFHAGNAQMWVYALSLAGLFVLWSCLNGSMPWSRIVQILPAGLIGIGIAAVLLVPQFLATRELQRTGGTGWDIREGVFALFAPYPTPIVTDLPEQRIYTDPEHFGAMYYAGSLFTFVFVGAFLIVGLWAGTARWFLRDPWKGLAVLTFLLALGHVAKLWTWQMQLPVFDQFNHPFKYLPFFHLFSCAVGAALMNRLIRRSSWQCATFIVVAGLLLYNAFWSRSALFVYAERPYPVLPSELAGLVRDGPPPVRILPLTHARSASGNYVVGLQHNFPTIYGISSIGGYDQIIEQDARYRTVLQSLQTDARATIRKHGVTHLVIHREMADAVKKRDWATDVWRRFPGWFGALIADCDDATPVMQTEHVRVFEVKDAKPIAYSLKKARDGLPVRWVPSGVDVDVSSLGTDEEVVLNFLWRPGICVYADGTLLPASDDGQRIRATVRAGTKNLALRYESPWATGFLLGGALVGVGFVMQTLSKRWS